MAKLAGKRVLITGAASGIGRCMVEEFLKADCELIVSDINEEALNKTVEDLKSFGPMYPYVLDVSNRKQVEDMAAKVLSERGNVDILINNAGIGHTGEIIETSLETWEKLVNINFWGPLYHIYAFLPAMVEANSGHIVNISSGQAFFRLPTWGPYATIKLAMGAISELMQVELKKFKIKVTTVYPFMINTGFYSDVEGDTFGTKMAMKLLPYYSMSPERVAKIIFKAVKKQKAVEKVTVLNDVGVLSRTVTPLSSIISTSTLHFMGKNPEDLKKDSELLS